MSAKASVLVIGGPTASGKSGLALALARQLDGVVINADSMQLYDGLPQLTAQPPPEDSVLVPHQLYGVLAPGDAATAARWRGMAIAEIKVAQLAGKRPIVVGGTGFYLRTLVSGISPIPEIDPSIRSQLVGRLAEEGLAALAAELAAKDAETAAGLDLANPQRVLRALEVWQGTGKGLSRWHAEQPPVAPDFKFSVITLLPDRDLLYRQCDQRFDAMMAAGVVEEVRAFDAIAPKETPLRHALGFQPLVDMCAGRQSKDAAVSAAKTETRQYAKRQVTWFRHQISANVILDRPDAALVPRAVLC